MSTFLPPAAQYCRGRACSSWVFWNREWPTCVCVCAYINKYVYIYIYISYSKHICVFTCICTCTYVYIHIHIFMFIEISMYIDVYIRAFRHLARALTAMLSLTWYCMPQHQHVSFFCLSLSPVSLWFLLLLIFIWHMLTGLCPIFSVGPSLFHSQRFTYRSIEPIEAMEVCPAETADLHCASIRLFQSEPMCSISSVYNTLWASVAILPSGI